MAPIPASTKPQFFERYDFGFDPRASLYAEFLRLAESRKWQEGSKSKKFESAWSECFGHNVPVNATEMEPCHSSDDEGLSSLLRNMQKLDIGKKKSRIKIKEVEPEFNLYYGDNDSVKVKWQALCQDCGVNPPSSIIKCKKVHSLCSDCSIRITADSCFYLLGTQRLEYQYLRIARGQKGRKGSISVWIQKEVG